MLIDSSKLKIRKGVIPSRKKEKPVIPNVERFLDNAQDNLRVLRLAQKYWEDLADWRARNYRNFMYYRGKQWHELVIVRDRDGKETQMTEEDYIKSQGKIPFKQNLIGPIIRSTVSQYRANPSKSIVIARAKENASKSEMLTNVLQAELDVNEIVELDAQNLKNFLIFGGVFGKVGYKYIPTLNREGVEVNNVADDRIFFNSGITDPRLKELNLIGEIIDAPIEDIISAFAKSKADEVAIRSLFTAGNQQFPGTGETLSQSDTAVNDFMVPNNLSLCRLYEIWELKADWRMYVHDYYDGTRECVDITQEQIDQINRERVAYYASQNVPEEEVPLMVGTMVFERYWYYKYLTPNGACLKEGETPYEHEEHPYAFSLYPLIKGEVWGLVEDSIDQQRFINRLIISQEFARSAAAKGVLLVPEDSIPDDMTIDDFAEEWTKYNGVIKIKVKPGAQIPQQISASAIDPNSNEAIQMQMDFMMRVSGVGNAIQGVTAKSGTPSSLYAQEAQNSAMNNVDLIQTFGSFKKRRDKKVLSVIRQYYEDRLITIAGKTYTKEAMMYKASEAKAMKDIDINIIQGADSPVFRSMMDDQLFKWVDTNKMDIEMALAHCSMPFAESLLADIRSRREEAQKQAMAQQQGMPPGQPQVQPQITA